MEQKFQRSVVQSTPLPRSEPRTKNDDASCFLPLQELLKLASNHLTGAALAPLSHLPCLTSLSLSRNAVEGVAGVTGYEASVEEALAGGGIDGGFRAADVKKRANSPARLLRCIAASD